LNTQREVNHATLMVDVAALVGTGDRRAALHRQKKTTRLKSKKAGPSPGS